MELVSPDILQKARLLGTPVLATFFACGLLLWVLGGRTHRFWMVLLTTLLTGVYGLYHGTEYGMQPLVAGLLLAIAAGALALSLIRILSFIGIGLLTWYIARLVAPNWNEPLACFLAGGLIGVLLFRVWVTVLASGLGTLLLVYSGISLTSKFITFDVIGWVGQNGPLVNWGCAVMTIIGILFQYLVRSRGADASAIVIGTNTKLMVTRMAIRVATTLPLTVGGAAIAVGKQADIRLFALTVRHHEIPANRPLGTRPARRRCSFNQCPARSGRSADSRPDRFRWQCHRPRHNAACRRLSHLRCCRS